MAIHTHRREFISLVGGVAAWPLAARAQQPALPVIGLLSPRTPSDDPQLLTAFRQGLKDAGFAEGQNVTIEYRFAGHQNERLPALAADLVHHQVAVIVAGGLVAAQAAKAATSTIPIVFTTGADPVQIGLVASLGRPGGNVTGMTTLNVEVAPKRLELAHELVPRATIIAVLVNPTNPNTETELRVLEAAAGALGLRLHILHASTERDFDRVFATLPQLRAGVLVISGTDTFLISRIERLAGLTVQHAVPTIFQFRQFAAAGGLMSYGGSNTNLYHQAGIYTGQILRGQKPADLPVQQSTKVELILNLKTAKTLGITVPISLLGRADEVIE
jgi:putative ABC transport system substrate-binding protein